MQRQKPGDKVWWTYSTTRGWGFQRRVPAIVVGVTAKRVTIRTLICVCGEWQPCDRSVQQSKLASREEPHALVDSLS